MAVGQADKASRGGRPISDRGDCGRRLGHGSGRWRGSWSRSARALLPAPAARDDDVLGDAAVEIVQVGHVGREGAATACWSYGVRSLRQTAEHIGTTAVGDDLSLLRTA